MQRFYLLASLLLYYTAPETSYVADKRLRIVHGAETSPQCVKAGTNTSAENHRTPEPVYVVVDALARIFSDRWTEDETEVSHSLYIEIDMVFPVSISTHSVMQLTCPTPS